MTTPNPSRPVATAPAAPHPKPGPPKPGPFGFAQRAILATIGLLTLNRDELLRSGLALSLAVMCVYAMRASLPPMPSPEELPGLAPKAGQGIGFSYLARLSGGSVSLLGNVVTTIAIALIFLTILNAWIIAAQTRRPLLQLSRKLLSLSISLTLVAMLSTAVVLFVFTAIDSIFPQFNLEDPNIELDYIQTSGFMIALLLSILLATPLLLILATRRRAEAIGVFTALKLGYRRMFGLTLSLLGLLIPVIVLGNYLRFALEGMLALGGPSWQVAGRGFGDGLSLVLFATTLGAYLGVVLRMLQDDAASGPISARPAKAAP